MLRPWSKTMKGTHRSSLGITVDVMRSIQERGEKGCTVSILCRISNLSHYVAMEQIERLINNNLVEKVHAENYKINSANRQLGVIYKLTDIGHKILAELNRLDEICKKHLGMGFIT